MTAKEALLNTKGAAVTLSCTENWIHKLTRRGDIRAYTYNEDGVLVIHEPHTARQGQGLYFYEKDLKAYKPRRRGRPKKIRSGRVG